MVGLRHAQPLVLVDVHWLNDERKVEEPTLKTLLDRIRVTREQLDGNAGMNAMHLDKRIRKQMRRTRLSGTDANDAGETASVVRKLVLGLVHEREDLLGTLTQAHAVLGEHGRAVRAVKERTATLARATSRRSPAPMTTSPYTT